MKKAYLMKSMAVMAIGIVVASCSKDVFSGSTVSEEDAAKNAENKLGITINPNQTWRMTQEVKAEVTVIKDYGEKYTVKIYQNNPLHAETGILLAKGEIENGGTFSQSFTAPKVDMLFAAYVDDKGYTYVRPVKVEDGKLTAVFGSDETRVTRRTATNSHVNIPTGTAKATILADCASILAKSVEVSSANASVNYAGYYGYVQSDYWNNPNNNNNWELRPDATKQWHPTANYEFNFKISNGNTWNGNIPRLGNAGVVFDHETSVQSEASPNCWDYNNNFGWVLKTVPTTLYIEQGGKWTIGANVTQTAGQGAIPDFVDCEIIVAGTLEVNGTLTMANQGRLIVLPTGQVTGSGTVTIANGSAEGKESYNFGTISVNTLNENFGNFFNYGTLSGTNLVGGAGTSCFVNHGRVNVTTAYGNNGVPANLQIKNNCWFKASGEVAAKVIENGQNAYLTCASMKTYAGYGADGLIGAYVSLDSGSLLHVDGMWRAVNATVYGPTSNNNAFLEIGTIKQWDYTPGTTGTVSGKIYFSYGSIERSDNNSDTESCINANIGEGVEFINENCAKVAPAEASECAPAYTPNPNPQQTTDAKPIYSYAFEDSKNCDYDMNDVVLRVQEVEVDGKAKLNLTLVASGATLNLNIRLYPAAEPQSGEVAHYDGNYQVLSYNNQTEVHAMLGVPEGTMVNTGAGATARFVTIQIDKGSYNPAALPIAIYAPATDVEMRLARTGEPPFGVIVPEQWKWPKEYVRVSWAYNATETDSEGDQSFATFASSTNSANSWYNYPTGSVMDDKDLTFE